MLVARAYKTELAPNNNQRTFMGRCCGASRFIYNWGLAEWQTQYEAGEKPSAYRLRKQFNAQKDELCPWIRMLPYAVTEAAFQNLGNAFRHFFRRVKNGEGKPGYPRFKKRGMQNSFQLRNCRVESNRIRLTHIGWMRLKEHDYIPRSDSGIKHGVYTTISERAGRWYISLPVTEDIPDANSTDGPVIGIDLGLKERAVLSTGERFQVPRVVDVYQRKKARLHRELSRRKKGSANWRKTKEKLQRVEAKIANVRRHWQHEISHYVTQEIHPCAIVLEDLNVSGMVQNHHLARAVSDAGFYELRRQIEYKADWAGIDLMRADPWFPSSRLCPECGSVNPSLTLADRIWTCDCGAVHDRDLNAARNLASLYIHN